MTGSIDNYKFDFVTEVEALANSLGAKADNLLFIHVAVDHPDEDSLPTVTLPHILAGKRIKGELLSENCGFAMYTYTDDPYQSSGSLPILDYNIDENNPPTVGQMIFIREKEESTALFGKANEPMMRLFTLYHETAHALSPDGPEVDDDNPLRESVADAYAALRLLQRFGDEARPFLSMLSWGRAFDVLGTGHTDHLTTTVLDKILADSKTRDFSKLPPAKLLVMAESYAAAWTPEPAMLSAARDVLLGQKKFLSETTLASPHNFTFYIGAKIFQPFLLPEGVVLGDGKPLQIAADRRALYAEMIDKRAAGMDLSDVFDSASVKPPAGPPVAETLAVIRPKGQKRLTIKL